MKIFQFYIIQNLLIKILSITCSSYLDCFNCKSESNNLCIWNENGCNSNSLKSSTYKLSDLLSCYDFSNTLYFIYQYCGNTELILQKKKLEISLPLNKQVYGNNNIYCRYNILNSKNKKFFVKTHLNKKLDPQPILMINKTKEIINVNKKNKIYTIKDKEEIDIIYYSETVYNEIPFKITISYNYYDIEPISVLFGILFFVFIFAVFAIGYYIYAKKKKIFLDINPVNRQEEIIQEKRKNAEKKFNEIKRIQYKNVIDKNNRNNCVICLENFEDEDEVIEMNCFHLFHYECIKKWFLPECIKKWFLPSNSVNINNSCPECRKELFNFGKIDQNQEINTSHNLNENFNNNNNNNNNNDNNNILRVMNNNQNNMNNNNSNNINDNNENQRNEILNN